MTREGLSRVRKRRTTFALLLVVLLGFPIHATAQGGPDVFGYTWDSIPFDWLDTTQTGSSIPIQVDDQEVIVALPWSFFFYGNAYDYIIVSDNGALRVSDGSEVKDVTFGNEALPSSGSNHPDIAAYWDDLNISQSGEVSVQHSPTTDRFVISWIGLPHFSYGGAVSFQVHLQPSGHIEFHYLDSAFGSASVDNGASATIGVQDQEGGTSLAGNYLDLGSFAGTLQPFTAYAITSPCIDADGDGHAALGDISCFGDDCDDSNPSIHPGSPEVCADGIDQNCSGYDQLTDFDQDGDYSVTCGDRKSVV